MKFRAELGDYSRLLYYLLAELFLMLDSRAKNMFPSFVGESLAEPEPMEPEEESGEEPQE